MKSILLTFIIFFAVICSRPASFKDPIVLIGVEGHDLRLIRQTLDNICLLNPKVVAIDIDLSEYNGTSDDLALIRTLHRCGSIVMPSVLYSIPSYDDKEILSVAAAYDINFLLRESGDTGFVSASVRESDSLKMPTNFLVSCELMDSKFYHFSVTTAMKFDSLATNKFIESNDSLVSLDLKRGIRSFKTFTSQQVLQGQIKTEDVKGKIVMIGYLGPEAIDKFLSPFSPDGKPDIYGLQYLANIVAQVLESD